MPKYFVSAGEPEHVTAATPLEAALASNLWKSGGWAADYADDPDQFLRDVSGRSWRVDELAGHGGVRRTHRVPIFDVMTAMNDGRAPPAGRLEDY